MCLFRLQKPLTCLLVYIGFCTFLAYPALGQPEYPMSSYIGPGTDYTYSQAIVQMNDVDVTQTGPNTAWNFTDLNVQLQTEQQCLQPSQTGYEAAFLISCVIAGYPTFQCLFLFNQFTNQALTSSGQMQLGPFSSSEVVRFQRKQDNVLEETMIGLLLETDTSENQFMVIYEQPDTVLQFPIHYEDSLSSTARIDLDLTDLGIDAAIKSTQMRSYLVDGWGSLQTPFAVFDNCLRLKMDLLRNDTVIVSGIPTPITTELTQYQWYSLDYGQPVLEIIEQASLQNLLIVNFIDTVRCFEPQALFNYSPQILFIGENGELAVSFFNTSGNADQFSWDFGDGSTSSVQNPLHSYTSAGVYQVQLVACNSNCTPLACDTTSLTLTIQDTTSSLFYLEGTSPLKAFPNPFSQEVRIEIPGRLPSDVTLWNAQGHLLYRERTQGESHAIPTGDLPAGVYVILLETPDSLYSARVVKIE